MKTRMNILCLLVFLLMGFSVVETAYYFTIGLKAGADPNPTMRNLEYVSVLPDDMTLLTDSVFNVKSQTYVPATYSHLLISVDTPENLWEQVARGLMVLAAVGCFLQAALYFLRLIIAINRSEIFSWDNVHRLRKVGLLMLSGFLLQGAQLWILFHRLDEVFAMQGYSFSLREALSLSNLLLGLVALIVAEVFAIGLRLKEEQELTI